MFQPSVSMHSFIIQWEDISRRKVKGLIFNYSSLATPFPIPRSQRRAPDWKVTGKINISQEISKQTLNCIKELWDRAETGQQGRLYFAYV